MLKGAGKRHALGAEHNLKIPYLANGSYSQDIANFHRLCYQLKANIAYESPNFRKIEVKAGMNDRLASQEERPAQLLESALDLLRAGDHEKGRIALEEIIEGYPDDLEAYGHLAWFWLGMNQADRAIPLYQKIIQKNPKDYQAKILLGQCFWRVGQNRKAREIAHTLEVPLSDSFSISQMIHLLMGMGRPGWEKALALAEQVVQEQKEPSDFQQRVQFLKILTSPPTGWGIKRRLRRLHSFLSDPKTPPHPSMILVLCPRLALDLGYPPIGLGRLAATLTRHQLPAQIIDMNLEIFSSIPGSWHPFWDQKYIHFWHNPRIIKDLFHLFRSPIDKLIQHIVASPVKLIGFSVFEQNRLFSIEMAKRIRQLAPEKCIIFGGPDCFPLKRAKTLYPTDSIDGFAVGEGENTLLEIVGRVQANESLEGIPGFWLSRTPLSDFQPVEQVASISSLALPTYREFKIALQSGRTETFFIEMSRGCIGKCDFCNDRQMWPGFRMGSPEDVVRQMKTIYKDFGVKNFYVVDPLINAHIPTLERLCDLIIESGMPASMGAAARVNPKMTLEIYQKMKKAGFHYISYGLESGSNKVLGAMRKGINTEWASQCLRLTREAGIDTGVFLIVGHPAEGEAEFQETLDFLTRNRDFITTIESVNLCDLHECSDLTLRAHEYGIRDPEHRIEWSSDHGSTYEVRCQRLERLLSHIVKLGYHLGFQLAPVVKK